MKNKDYYKLTVAVVVCQLAGIIGSVATSSSVSTWYSTLTKPALNPPGWVFGPVWITLYLLMGIALFLIWKKGVKRNEVKVAMSVFGAQLILNTVWSLLFFGAQNPGWALVDIVLLWAAIVWTIALFYKVSQPAAYLLVPYILWVSFAAYLNYALWILN